MKKINQYLKSKNGLKPIFLRNEVIFHFVMGFILEAKNTVLFHCVGGMHRTGMIALLLRFLQGGDWVKPFSKPIKVIIRKKKKFFIEVKLKNKAELEYYLHNKYLFREKNIMSVNKLIKTERFLALKRKYQVALNLNSKC